tara:strand:+ start:500 stop:2530 length:2031 start_codon:yes stop_codon:yes gene_type:complete
MLSVESSRPVSLREAHFRAIGRELPRPLVKPSKTALKKPPQKGFRLAKKRAKGGFARDKEVIKKFSKNITGVARGKDLVESVSLQPRKSKKQKEDEEALEIIRDEKLTKPSESVSKVAEAEINRKIDKLDKGFDDKLYAWSSVAESVLQQARIFGSEPDPSERRRLRERTTIAGGSVSNIDSEERFFRQDTTYGDKQRLLEDYPQNIALIKAYRDEGVITDGLYNQLELAIRQYNRQQRITEDTALERNASQGLRIVRSIQKKGGRYAGTEEGDVSVLDPLASGLGSSVNQQLQEKLRVAREQRAREDKERDEQFEAQEQVNRLKRGQKIFSGVDAGFYSARQEQKEIGLLEHSSQEGTSSGDSVRSDRGLGAYTDDEDRLSSGSLRSDGTSTTEREAVASELDRVGIATLQTAMDTGGFSGFGRSRETKPLDRKQARTPRSRLVQSEPDTKALESDGELSREIASNISKQTAISQRLTNIRRRSGQHATSREAQLSQEAPLLEELTQLQSQERKLQSKRAEKKQQKREEQSASDFFRELAKGGGLSTATQIRVASESGGKSQYGVKPRSKAQAKKLLQEMAEQPRELTSEEANTHFDNLDSFLTAQQEPSPRLSPAERSPRLVALEEREAQREADRKRLLEQGLLQAEQTSPPATETTLDELVAQSPTIGTIQSD